jgi:RNA-directed DNA polymerase
MTHLEYDFKSPAEAVYRFYLLYEKYLLYDKICRVDMLAHAHALARANAGALGVDGMTFAPV